MNIPETKITTLSNGLRVATEHAPSETCTVGLWIGSGSRFETERNNGTAHFLEHMYFKGTGNRTRIQLESEIEQMGAHLNAYTSREQTAYYARCLKKDSERMVSILGDILLNSELDAGLIEQERDTILREKEEVEKIHEEVVFDHLHATAYQGTSLGLTILGSDENIRTIKREDLVSYINNHYTAQNMVLVGAGGVDHDKLCEMGERVFKGLRSQSRVPAPPSTEFTGSEVRIRDDTMRDAHLAFAVEGVGWNHPDHIPLLVAQTIVGSWDKSLGNGLHLSSKLAQQVSANELCNSFTSFNTTYTDTGLFGVYAVAGDRTKLIELSETILKTWRRQCVNATDADVYRAKNQLKTSLLLSLDSSVQVAEEIGRHVLCYGRRISPFELDKMIEQVDAAKVRQVALEYLYDSDPAVVGYGPVESLQDYNRIRSAMSPIYV